MYKEKKHFLKSIKRIKDTIYKSERTGAIPLKIKTFHCILQEAK